MSNTGKDWFTKVFSKAKNMQVLEQKGTQCKELKASSLQSEHALENSGPLSAAAIDDTPYFAEPFDNDHDNWQSLVEEERRQQ